MNPDELYQPLDASSVILLRARLEGGLEELLASTAARVALSLRLTNGTVVLEHNAQRQQPAASLIKLPILLTLLEKVASGELKLDQQLSLDGLERVGGTGILSQLPSIGSLTLAELARLMIILSDNLATNALIRLLSLDAVNDWCKRHGLEQTVLQRYMMDIPARLSGQDNFTSAADSTKSVCWLLDTNNLPATLRQFSLSLLIDQQDRSHFGAQLPAGTMLANKTGQLPGLRHDVGILNYGAHSLVLAVLADQFTDTVTSQNLHGGEGAWQLSEIARFVAHQLTTLD